MSVPLQTENQSQPKKEFSRVVSVVGIILTSIILFTGGYFYLQYLQTQNIEETEKTQAAEKRQEDERIKQIEENVKNDQTRKLDLANLEKGLGKYFTQNKKYPEKLEELTADYLIVIPLDPISKEPYRYVPGKDLDNYVLSAKLSNGSEYTVNPQE